MTVGDVAGWDVKATVLKAEVSYSSKKLGRFWVYWFPVVVYMATIFFLSSRSTFPIALPKIPHMDKVCHFVEFMILGTLLMRAFIHEEGSWLSRHALLLAVGVAVLFGLSDEFHQLFVPFRQVDLFDFLADSLGAASGAWIAIGMHWLINYRQRKGHE